MKKFVICLLLICTICLGCFALTACDKNDQPSDGIPRNTFWKVENSPFSTGVCYAFYYTGEHPLFYVNLCRNDELLERYSKHENNMYFETLTDNPHSQYHHHIIKPNTIVYINIYDQYFYQATKIEFVTYNYDTNGNRINETVLFTNAF